MSETELSRWVEAAVNRGLVRILCDERHLRWLPQAELRSVVPA
jgi:hypothetical protein